MNEPTLNKKITPERNAIPGTIPGVYDEQDMVNKILELPRDMKLIMYGQALAFTYKNDSQPTKTSEV